MLIGKQQAFEKIALLAYLPRTLKRSLVMGRIPFLPIPNYVDAKPHPYLTM